MKRFDHPARRANPYSDDGSKIAGFRYDTALVLLRLRDAVPMRSGEDADYLTAGPFICSWHAPDEGWRQITVPAGMITDLTSTPRVLRGLVGRVGPWLEAAILHDYLYIAWQDVPGRGPTRADRKFADDMMRAAMQTAGVGPLAVWAIHAALRLLGGATYRSRNAERYVDLSEPSIQEQLPRLP